MPSYLATTAGTSLVAALLLGTGLPYMYLLAPLPLGPAGQPQLGSLEYDIVPIDAPAATGKILEGLAALFSARPVGPLLVRGLLNQNGVWKLRELTETEYYSRSELHVRHMHGLLSDPAGLILGPITFQYRMDNRLIGF